MAERAVRALTAKFKSDTTDFKKGANEVRAKLTELNTAMYQNRKAQKEVDQQLKDLAKQEKALKEAINSVKEPTDEMKQDYEALTKKTNELFLQKSKLKTEEAELRSQISKTNRELEDSKNSAEKSAEGLKQLGSVVKKVTTLAATGGVALFTMTANMAESADEINELSKETGISTAELQKMMYAADLVDVEVSTLTGSLSKLVKNMNSASKGTGSAYDAFSALGISVTDSTGALRNNQDVFYEVIEALGKIENETQRDAYAMSIFGKSAQELNPLILGGTEQLKAFGDELERNGLILSQDQLDKLNEFNDKIDSFKAKLQAQLMSNASDAVDEFDELLDKSDDIIIMISDIIQAGVKVAGVVVDNKEVVLALVAAMVTFKASMAIGSSISSAVTAIKSFTTATEGATVAQTAMNAAGNANPYLLIASAAIAATAALISFAVASSNSEKTNDSYAESLENIKKSTSEIVSKAETEVSNLRAKGKAYEELRDKADRTVAEENQLLKIAKELEESYPNQIELIDKTTGAYKSLGDQVEKTAESILNAAKKNAYSNAMTDAYTKLFEIEQEIKNFNIEFLTDQYGNPIITFDDDGFAYAIKSVSEDIQDIINDYNILVSSQNGFQSAIEEYTKGYNDIASSEISLSDETEDLKDTNGELLTMLGEVEAKLKLLRDAQEEYNTTGKLTQSTLSGIVEKYPELSNVVDNYIAGLVDEKALLSELSKAYETDYNNYKSAVLAKSKVGDDYYKKAVSDSSSYINQLASQYGIDLKNYKTLSEAKLTIQKAFLNSMADNWEKYYNAQTQTWTIDSKDLVQYKKELMASGMSSSQADAQISRYKTEYQQALKAVSAWKSFSAKIDESLSNVSYTPNYYEPQYTSSSTSDTGSSTSAGSITFSSSSSKTESVYDTAYLAYKELVDRRLELIKQWTDAEKNAADERIDAIDAEVEARKKLKEDEDIQKQIDAVNAQLKYSKLDNFSRMELERQLESLKEQQEETEYNRSVEAQKEAIQAESDAKIAEWEAISKDIQNNESYAKQLFSDLANGYTSTQTIITNNTQNANIQIVNTALTEAQVEQKIKDKLGMELIT